MNDLFPPAAPDRIEAHGHTYIREDLTNAPKNMWDCAEAFELYNTRAELNGWARCQKPTKARHGKMKRRLADCGGIDGWIDALGKVEKSDFLSGRTSHGYKMNIDFLLQESSFTKLMEGAYGRSDNTPTNGGGANARAGGQRPSSLEAASRLVANVRRGEG